MQCGFSEDLSRGGKVTARGMRHISFGAIGVVAFTAVAFSFVKSHSFGLCSISRKANCRSSNACVHSKSSL